MPLYYDDDQTMLAETAQQFMAEEGAIAKQLRHWRDRNCKDGFGHGLWKQFAEMGFTGMLVDEDDAADCCATVENSCPPAESREESSIASPGLTIRF